MVNVLLLFLLVVTRVCCCDSAWQKHGTNKTEDTKQHNILKWCLVQGHSFSNIVCGFNKFVISLRLTQQVVFDPAVFNTF